MKKKKQPKTILGINKQDIDADPLLQEAIASALLAGAKSIKLLESTYGKCDCDSADKLKKLRYERIHDLNQIGGLQQENRLLTQLLDELDEAIYFFDCNSDTAKCNRRIDSIVNRYRRHKKSER